MGRSPAKTAAVAAELGVDHFLADFAELDQVRTLAARLRERCPRLDVLANNAGGVMGPRTETIDGHELTFQVNHLAGFLLTNLLMDRLIASGGSVLNTSSVANRLFGHLDIDDLDAHRTYSQASAYGNAKLANILFTTELHRRHHGDGVSTAAFHPGNVATNFAKESGPLLFRLLYDTPLKRIGLVSPEKGSDNLVWLATAAPGVDWESGRYYVRRHTGRPNRQATDPALARELWDRSAAMVGLGTQLAAEDQRPPAHHFWGPGASALSQHSVSEGGLEPPRPFKGTSTSS